MRVFAAHVPLRRNLAFIVAALTALFGVSSQAAPPARVVAVGDLHGDFDAWQAIARSAGILDAKGHWAGAKAILVQLGDVTDRGPDSLKIIRSLQQLQREAPRKGGKVYVVLGNHEAMNLLGRERVYEANRAQLEAVSRAQNPQVTPEQVRANWMASHPLGWVEHTLAWKPSGELGQWATKNPAILKIGNTLFAHGGVSVEYSKQPIDTVNKRVAAAMGAADDTPASILSDPLGPLWYRGLVGADSDAQAERAAAKPLLSPLTPQQELDAVLGAYGAQRLVIGHTPSLKGIQISTDNRLARIDTGNSRFYGGPLSWLEIIGDRMIPHTVARSP